MTAFLVGVFALGCTVALVRQVRERERRVDQWAVVNTAEGIVEDEWHRLLAKAARERNLQIAAELEQRLLYGKEPDGTS